MITIVNRTNKDLKTLFKTYYRDLRCYNRHFTQIIFTERYMTLLSNGITIYEVFGRKK